MWKTLGYHRDSHKRRDPLTVMTLVIKAISFSIIKEGAKRFTTDSRRGIQYLVLVKRHRDVLLRECFAFVLRRVNAHRADENLLRGWQRRARVERASGPWAQEGAVVCMQGGDNRCVEINSKTCGQVSEHSHR